MFEERENNNIDFILQINDIFLFRELYSCTMCSSGTNITYFNEKEGIIEFRCVKKPSHIFKINIADILEKIENNIKKDLYKDICPYHKSIENVYLSYCFDCKKNLCEECLNTGEHIHHKTVNISEVQSNKEIIQNILKKIIEDNNEKIKNMENEKNKKISEIDNKLNNELKNEKIKSQKKLKSYEKEKRNEIKLNEEKYINKVNELQKRFHQELKELNSQYEKDKVEIMNKYNLKFKSEEIYIKNKIKIINEKFEKLKNKLNYEFKFQMKNIQNLSRINELIFETYTAYNYNFYSAVNVNNIIYYYSQNDDIRNNIMKIISKNDFEELLKGVKIKYENLKKVIQKFNKEKEIEKKINDNLKNEDKEEQGKEVILENIKNINSFGEINSDKVKSIYLI